MDRKIGLLGGGQLGQMLCEAANPLGIEIVILDAENSPVSAYRELVYSRANLAA